MPVRQRLRAELLRCEPGASVLAAIEVLLASDRYLLDVDANERSISHRLAFHLNGRFDGYDVDCEYNRDDIYPKRIRRLDLHPDEDDDERQTVFPDIIVHRRGAKDNYLVVEVKKSSSRVDRAIDMAKLQCYKADQCLEFRFALFLEFGVGAGAGLSQARWVNA